MARVSYALEPRLYSANRFLERTGFSLDVLSHTPRFELHRMQNIRGRDTASLDVPTTRTAPYLIDAGANSFVWLDAFRGIQRECLVFSAIDTAKDEDVSLVGLSAGQGRPPCSLGTTCF